MAAASFQKINKAALAEMRTHKKMTMVTLIFYVLGAFLYIATSGFSQYDYYDADDICINNISFDPSPLAIFIFGAAVLVGIIAVVLIFRDMTSIQHCDIQHSLPMSAAQRFKSKLLAVTYMHILPTLVFVGGSVLIAHFQCLANDAANGYINTFVFLCFFAAALFTDAVAVFTVCCCGALAESIYFSMILVGCLSVTPALAWTYVWSSCGCNYNGEISRKLGLWSYSVVLALVESESETGPDGWSYLIVLVNVLISVAVMLLSYFIYRKRDARTVGTPIVSRLFFEIVMALGVFSVYFMFVASSINMIYGLVVVVIIYLIINVVISRAKLNVKSFLVWIGKYALTTVVFLVFACAAYITGGFGSVNYIPQDDLLNYNVSVYIDRYRYSEDPDGYVILRSESFGKNGRSSDLTDDQVREVSRIISKYMIRSNDSVSDYIDSMFSDNDYSYSSNEGTINFEIFGPPRSYRSRSGKTYATSDRVVSRSATIRSDDGSIEQLIKELEDLGYLIKKTDDGVDYMIDKYVYE